MNALDSLAKNLYASVAGFFREQKVDGVKLALRLTPYAIDEIGTGGGLILVDLATMVVAWGIVRRVVAR